MSFVSSPIKPDVKTFKLYGDTPPLNYFDPFNFNPVDESKIKWCREAELNHGRTAMLAAVSYPIHPLPDLPLLVQYLPFWTGMVLYEFYRINIGFKAPNSGNVFSLLESYQPGNVFDIDPETVSETKYNQELNNGRLAMLACAHFLATDML